MLDPQFFALTLADWILIGTSFFASFMAAVAGLGGGVLLLAVMVSFFPPAVVIPLHGVIQLGSNGFRALIMRQFFKQDILLAFTFGSILAAIIGSQVAVSLDETLLKVILGILAVLLAPLPPCLLTLLAQLQRHLWAEKRCRKKRKSPPMPLSCRYSMALKSLSLAF